MEKIVQLGRITDVALTEKLYTSNLDVRNDGEYHVSLIIRFTYETEQKESKFAAALAKLNKNVRESLAKVSGGDNTYHCIEFGDVLLDEDTLNDLWPKTKDEDEDEPTRKAPSKKEQAAIRKAVRELLQDENGKYIEYPFTTVMVSASDVLKSANVTKGISDGKEITFSSIYSLAKKRAYPYFYRSRFGERTDAYCERVGNNLLTKNTAKLLERTDFVPESEKGWDMVTAYEKKMKKGKSKLNEPKDEDEFDLDLDE